MGRPIYNYELSDPDFSWLINNFKETHPEYTFVESTGLPLVFVLPPEEIKAIDHNTTTEEYEVPPIVEPKKASNLRENK